MVASRRCRFMTRTLLQCRQHKINNLHIPLFRGGNKWKLCFECANQKQQKQIAKAILNGIGNRTWVDRVAAEC